MPVAEFFGEVDSHSAPRLRAVIKEAAARAVGSSYVVVDLSAVGFVDSVGLGVLIGQRRDLREVGGDLRLVAPSGPVLRLLEAAGLAEVFKVYPDLDSAVGRTSTIAHEALGPQLLPQAFDALTGLPNRNLLTDRLEHALARIGRQQRSMAMLFLDLDNFKAVNDRLGHEAGDRLLVSVARRLQACMRSGDTVARLGGDEFICLLENADVNGAIEVAERIGDGLRAAFSIGGQEVFVATSIGIALSDSAQDRPGDLLRKADAAMYQAKEKGESHYEVFRPSMYARALERKVLEDDLRRAVEREEFELCYQPKMELAAGGNARMGGMEALVRWRHPERGLMLPSGFIPIAEETGLIVPIGQWVLKEACGQTREWRDRYPGAAPPMVSVNLSPRQFQQPDLVGTVAATLRETGLEPSRVQLEITENVLIENAESAIVTLRRLKSSGVSLAIDDFGTGYSSLSTLIRYPVDELKIDKSFIGRTGEHVESMAIVEMVIDLGHKMGMRVTAEGVETAPQLARLRGMGCDLAQGFYFNRPLSSEAASTLLEEGLLP